MKDAFKGKSFKVLIITLIILIIITGVSTIFDTSVLSSAVGYITTGMQRVSATVVGDNNDDKTYDELLEENQQLKREVTSLRSQLADYNDVKEENARLWKYYGLKKQDNNYEFVPVSVIRRDAGDSFYSFTVDRGSNENVKINDPVVTENGLVGYVKSVSASHSIVTTILSPDLSAGAKDVATGDTGIVSGDAEYSEDNLITMKKLAGGNKIKAGDQISTTGIGGLYPQNLSIGVVKEIKYEKFDNSIYAVVKPYEDVKTITNAVVITSFKGQGNISPSGDKEE